MARPTENVSRVAGLRCYLGFTMNGIGDTKPIGAKWRRKMGIKHATWVTNALLFATMLLGFTCGAGGGEAGRTVQVSGSGTDLLNGAVVHSKKETATGIIQHGTEVVELSGDLTGKVLYHVTTVIDNQKQTLTNTGDQVFSGTVKGSAPVMLHDSRFRFEVNLATGAETGSVYFSDHIAGPAVRCELKVTGSGKAADGNPTFNYIGHCEFGSSNSDSKKTAPAEGAR